MSNTENLPVDHHAVGTSTFLQPGHNHTGEITLIDLFLILWKGKYIIVACVTLATVIGVLYALFTAEVFTSTSHFITKTGRSGAGSNLGQLAALAGIPMNTAGKVDPSDYLDKVILDQKFIATLFERKWLFKGDSLPLEQIIGIQMDTTINNWQHVYHMSKIDAVRKGKILAINKEAKNGLLTLSSSSTDPQLAYDLNRFTLDFISEYIRNSIQTQASEKRLFIEKRLKEVKGDLQNSENALVRFKERNLMSNSPQIAIEEARLTRQVTLNQEVYIQFQKQYEMARIEELDDQTLVQVIHSPEIPIDRSKPNRKMIVVVAFMTGIFAGVFGAFLSNMIFASIQAADFKAANKKI